MDTNYGLPKTSELYDIIDDFFGFRQKGKRHSITEYVSQFKVVRAKLIDTKLGRRT